MGYIRYRTRPDDVTNSLVMSGHLSVGDRWRIISLRFDQGMAPNQIATVFNILRLYRETDNVIEREGRGRTLLDNRKRIQHNIIIHRMIENFIRYQMV